MGEITFAVPQVREGGFYPSALEKGLRSEQALVTTLAEMYVQGVSTRKVKTITEQLCGIEISAMQVSRAACASDDLTLYVFISRSSDHLLNLEHRPEVVVAVDERELHGTARLLAQEDIAARINLCDHIANAKNQTCDCTAEIRPTRLTFHSPSGQGNIETIDFF